MTQQQLAAELELNTARYRKWSVRALTVGARMAEELETPVSGDMLAHYRNLSPRTLARRRAVIRALAEDAAA